MHYRKLECLAAQQQHKDLKGMHCTDTKNVWLLNALLLMTIRPAYIRVRQYTESNFV